MRGRVLSEGIKRQNNDLSVHSGGKIRSRLFSTSARERFGHLPAKMATSFTTKMPGGVLHCTEVRHPTPYIAVATSFLWSLRFCLISASSRGSKNASSIAYVHVPRSRSPKRSAGLSKSFRSRCLRISVSSLMVICWPDVLCAGGRVARTKRSKRVSVCCTMYHTNAKLSISLARCVHSTSSRHRKFRVLRRLYPDTVHPRQCEEISSQFLAVRLPQATRSKQHAFKTKVAPNTEISTTRGKRRTLNGLRGLLSSGPRPSAAARRPAS